MSTRSTMFLSALAWPVGLLIVVAAMEIDGVTLPVVLGLDIVYVGGVLALLRAWDGGADRRAAALVVTGPGLFALVGFAGPPTADEPGLMMLNTAVLLGVALALLVVLVQIVVDHRSSPYVAAVVPAMVLLVIGTSLYLANLVARVAVVLAGAADQQAAVEDRAWVAFEYLRGLDGSPDFMSYLLVWFDLIQLGYVATTYVAIGAVARLLWREDRVSARAGRRIALAAYGQAVVLVAGVIAAVSLPHQVDLVPAWAAFVTSIPFMTTLVPFALGLAMLSHRAAAQRAARSWQKSPRPRRRAVV